MQIGCPMPPRVRLSACRFFGHRTAVPPGGALRQVRTRLLRAAQMRRQKGGVTGLYIYRQANGTHATARRMPLLRQGLQAHRRVEARTAYAAADAVGAQGQIQCRREYVGSRPFVVQPGQ